MSISMQFKYTLTPQSLNQDQLSGVINKLYLTCKKVLNNYLHITDRIVFKLKSEDKSARNANTTTYGDVASYSDEGHFQILTLYRDSFLANQLPYIPYICTGSIIMQQLNQIVDTILHEYCHIYQNQNKTYELQQRQLFKNKTGKHISFEQYRDLPWEIEARDFAKLFRKTAEFKEIDKVVNEIYSKYKGEKSSVIEFNSTYKFNQDDCLSLALAA